MLNLIAKTRVITSANFPVADGYVISGEGQALAQVFEDGIEKVRPSTADEFQVFIGFSYGENYTPSTMSIVEELTVPAETAYTIELKQTPLSGQIRVYDVTASAAVTAGTPATEAAQYSISGKTITVNSAKASHVIKVVYRYAPTVMDLMEASLPISTFTAADTVGMVGAIQKGEVYTDLFDASSDWDSATTTVRLGAGGVVTTGGSGLAIPNCTVCHRPTVEMPYLGLRLL